MIDFLIAIGKLLLAALPFVVLCFLSAKINLNEKERSRQFAMPVIALVYAIVGMLLMDTINDWLLWVIHAIPQWIDNLAYVSWMPEMISGWLVNLSDWVEKLLSGLNLEYWIFFISNAVILLVYLMLKNMCIGLIRKLVKPDGKIYQKVAPLFYRFYFERSAWYLKESYTQVRGFLKTFYYGAVVVSTLLMLYSSHLYLTDVLTTVFYPVFGVLVLGELYFYLGGITRKEYGTITGEDDDAYRMVNYSLLRKFLRSLFKDKLLAENTGLNSALAYTVATDDILQELEKSEDPKVTTFASYIKQLHKAGFPVDHNYVYSALDLLQGKSILFNTPFYKDLIPYAFYPMNRLLLGHRKVLVVLGRHGMEEDVKEWLEQGIGAVTNIPFLWDVQVLDKEGKTPDIGIITRADVLNTELHNANTAFLKEVGMVVILEPSKLITTAQIGLNLLIKCCGAREDKEIVYCLCDKNCDGLVDAMSHILLTSLTEVSATNKHKGTVSYMCWEADKDYLHHRLIPNISRYLGLGTEIAFAALKNQIAKTAWYGGETFPVTDMRWIARQYYYDLTKYAGLPGNQESMDEFFRTSANFWSADVEKNNFFVVEDEACNMFEILRDFSTRTTEQGFINVLSPEYLLKDYMADNASIFETDAKAIPTIVADYARTNRNALQQLLLLMSTHPVGAGILERELSLLGITVTDLPRQLWYEVYKCYACARDIATLSGDATVDVQTVWERAIELEGETFTAAIFCIEDAFNLEKGCLEPTYVIRDPAFIARCVAPLRSASFVTEDERGQRHYLGTELAGHVYQKHLPGQFFTFGGKYYEMQYLTADGQILVRRAADHIDGRPAYRQLRQYTLLGTTPSKQVGAVRDVAGLKVVREFADILVETPGFYQMDRYNDFATAKKTLFHENNGIAPRHYRNKELLRIELPDMDGKCSERVQHTIAMLFNEIFRTLFAENAAFICALIAAPAQETEGIDPLTCFIKAEGMELPSNAIYIIEDSQLDLGLTVAVERNLQRIFAIMQDYLDWHNTTLENSVAPPPPPPSPVTFSNEEGTPKKKGLLQRIREKIRNLFRRKKKGDEPTGDDISATGDVPPAEGTTPPAETTPPAGEALAENPPAGETPALSLTDKNAPPEEPHALSGEQDNPVVGLIPERRPYHQRYYLLFGDVNEPTCIDQGGTKAYLEAMGFGDNNPLRRAREGRRIAETIEATFKPGRANSRYCDFCGTEIFGVEYETLADGRDRCLHCSRTAIKSGEEFKTIFEDVRRNMEAFFGIRLNVAVQVEMVNAKTLHKRLGHSFTPTPTRDGRVLGVAIKDRRGNFSLLVENGSPRMASVMTMAHELTHIWQYVNWNDRAIRRQYGKKMELEVYEGMAKWVEVQYAYLINEPALAKRTEIITAFRDDEYGRGFLRYRANYPFSTGTVLTRNTPFMDTELPLSPDYCGEITVVTPHDNGTGLPEEGDAPTGGNGGGNGGSTPPPPAPPAGEAADGPTDRTPNDAPAFCYRLLEGTDKAAYELFLDAIMAFTPELTAVPPGLTIDRAKDIMTYVQADHPELFWHYYNSTYFYQPETGLVSSIRFDYPLTKEQADTRLEEIREAIAPFLASLSDTMSDFEVVQRVYENIIRLVDYDTVGLERQRKLPRNVREGEPDDLRSIYGVFVQKKAVCAGYAKAMQYLLNLMGIECVYVTSEKHAWNLLKLEGDYYHLDVTWGDGSNTKAEANITDAVDYSCFCITTEEALRLGDHEPEAHTPLPTCTAVKCNYHHRYGLYFDAPDYERMRVMVCDAIARGNKTVSFKFATDALYEQMRSELVEGGKLGEMLRYANLKNRTQVSMRYTYVPAANKRILTFYLTLL